MSNVILLRNREERTRQNNRVFASAVRLSNTVQKLIKAGYTVHNMRFETGTGKPVIEVLDCPLCKKLGGASYKTECDEQGKKFIWQSISNDCRVEWTVRA